MFLFKNINTNERKHGTSKDINKLHLDNGFILESSSNQINENIKSGSRENIKIPQSDERNINSNSLRKSEHEKYNKICKKIENISTQFKQSESGKNLTGNTYR
jgi:hypothetical protein